jgi:CcmD family protein
MPSVLHLIAAYAVVFVGLGLYVLALRSQRARLAREIDAPTHRDDAGS